MTLTHNARRGIPLLLGLMLAGCSTSKEELLPPGDSSMLALWQGNAPSVQVGAKAREVLRREPGDDERGVSGEVAQSYSRTEASEISQVFPRLPNPDVVMYIFPHMSEGNTPVPGYSTVFPFYHQTQYALPGERTEAL